MKCYNHPEKDSTGTCQRCGKALCRECSSKYTICLCDECFISEKNESIENATRHLNALTKEYVISALIGVIVCAFYFWFVDMGNKQIGLAQTMVTAFIVFCIPYGYVMMSKIINRLMPNLIVMGALMLFFYVFKLTGAVLLGCPAFIVTTVIYVFRFH